MDSRQVLHVGYGAILEEFRPRLYQVWNDHEEEHYQIIADHFVTYLAPSRCTRVRPRGPYALSLSKGTATPPARGTPPTWACVILNAIAAVIRIVTLDQHKSFFFSRRL